MKLIVTMRVRPKYGDDTKALIETLINNLEKDMNVYVNVDEIKILLREDAK
jgi:hypothetical protein